VLGIFAELNVAAERSVEQLAGGISSLGHQQCFVTRPPDDRHRFDDLPAPAAH
jgi:hypothetical protein